ncbi:MAG: hypothetical protein RI907_3306 [Pseudomonadota bacterium]|jgi:ribose-phosphate pyrophosphokinase
MGTSTLLVYTEDQAPAALALAEACGVPARVVARHRFPDGEWKLTLPFAPEHSETVPTQLVVFRSLHQPNEKLLEVLLVCGQARAWGVKRIVLVAPYLAYMRQDISFHPGEVVSQRVLGHLLAAHIDGLLTVDPHLHRVATLGEAVPVSPAVALSAAPALARHVGEALGPEARPVLIGPDGESAPWVASAAATLGCDHGVCSKVRHGDRDVEVQLPTIDVSGRAVVLIDDIASSGRTLAVATRLLLAQGAASVDVAITHALFESGAVELIRSAGVRHIWSSDAVAHDTNAVPLAALMAPALREALARPISSSPSTPQAPA